MPRRPITVDEAAKRYGVHRRTISRLIKDGRITAYRLGPRLIRLDSDELDAQIFGEPYKTKTEPEQVTT